MTSDEQKFLIDTCEERWAAIFEKWKQNPEFRAVLDMSTVRAKGERLRVDNEEYTVVTCQGETEVPADFKPYTMKDIAEMETNVAALYDAWTESPEIFTDLSWADEDPGTCQECGAPMEHVRPGKVQRTCDCDMIV